MSQSRMFGDSPFGPIGKTNPARPSSASANVRVKQCRGGKELPTLADSADHQETRHPGSSRYLSGDAAHAGDRSAEARFTEDAQGAATPCEPQDHGRRVCADDRGERPERNELSDDGDSCWMRTSRFNRWRRNRGPCERDKSWTATNRGRSKLDQAWKCSP
jgi:hypothetical protein